MPVEVRELIIRAVVNTDPPEEQPEETSQLTEEAYARLIQKCVQQVLRILQKTKER
jgi:hypothetical protein